MQHFWNIRHQKCCDLETLVGVTQGHRKLYHSIRHPWLPINVP